MTFERGFPVSKYDLACRATDAGIAAMRPGVRACDVWQAIVDVLAPGGATGGGVGRMGHGVGLHNTEWPSLMAADQTILQEGMILAIEPGYDFATRKMMLHEENVVVRADRAELITRRATGDIPIL